MNIRGMDPAALAAATDLFVVAAPPRDDSSNDFRRALQPPAPPRCGTPNESHSPQPSQEAIADRKRSQQENASAQSTPASSEQQKTIDDKPTHSTESNDVDPQAAATEATAVEDAPVEEAEEENVAIESIAAAANQIAGLVQSKQQVPTATEVAIVTQPVETEESTNVTTGDVDLELAAAQNSAEASEQELTKEQAVQLPQEAAVEAVAEATRELPEAIAVEEPANQIEGTSTTDLPAATVTTTNASTAAVHPTTNPRGSRSTQDRSEGIKQASATAEQANNDVPSTVEATEVPAGSQMMYEEITRDKGDSKQSTQTDVAAALPVTAQTNDASATQTNTNDSTLAAPANQAANETAATPSANRESPAIHQTQSNVTAAIINRLPAQALIRHSQSAAPESAPLHVDAARFLQRVSKAFDSARERGGEIRIRLSPPELGALRVEVNMQDQGLVARLEVETTEARAVLLENLPALRERLAEQGLRLEKFDVELSQREPQQQGGHLPDQPRDRNPQGETRATKNFTARPTATTTPTSIPSSTNGLPDRQLNVIV